MKNADTTKTTRYSEKLSEADWTRFDAMTAEERHQAALSDPDAQPMSDSDWARMKRTPQAKIIRRALALTQEEFSRRFHIPLDTLRDWEDGRAQPDQPTLAYLRVIASDPESVSRVLREQGESSV